MPTFRFAIDATETLRGCAYFEVEAATEQAARAKLIEDSSEYFVDFSESYGSTEWETGKPDAFDLLGQPEPAHSPA
jgi:hypothetical protein